MPASNHLYSITHSQQLITDLKGRVKSVILPAKKFEKLVELLEDYGLGLAMKKTLGDKLYTRKEALRRLSE